MTRELKRPDMEPLISYARVDTPPPTYFRRKSWARVYLVPFRGMS